MEQKYAQALVHLIENGIKPSEAVAAVAKALKARGREALLPRVARAFESLAHKHVARSAAVITVARERDGESARAEAQAPDALVRVDETLIGGWRLEKGGVLVDASYKKHLLEMYNRATRA